MRDLKIFTDNIEESAVQQIDLLLSQEAFKNSKVRIMPDVHAGAGCVIGFTGDLGEKVIPNIVGVDIGCGMLTISLGNVEIDFVELDEVIKNHVPAGFNVFPNKLEEGFLRSLRCYSHLKNIPHIEASIGTLGGGNHFIEVGEDKEKNKYLIIHTGSRNLGKQVCDLYQKLAISREKEGHGLKHKDAVAEIVERCKKLGKEKEIEGQIKKFKKSLTDKCPDDLCYLEGQDRLNYLHDMKFCQKFATKNRKEIAKTILEKMHLQNRGHFETVHNYIDFQDNIVRKGAISSKKGEQLLIPINMKDGCILGEGKGNEDWNCSAPHGAGRIMSRSQARKNINLEEYRETMKGISSTSVNISTIDEAPFAYRRIEEIIDKIQDTVEIKAIIKPLYNFKSS